MDSLPAPVLLDWYHRQRSKSHCCLPLQIKSPIYISNARKLSSHQSSPHFDLILIWTTSIWKLKPCAWGYEKERERQKKKRNHKFLLPLASLLLFDATKIPRDPGIGSSVTLNTSMEQFGKHKPPNHYGSDWISRKNCCDKFWTAAACPVGGNNGPETQNLSILKTQWRPRAGSFPLNHCLWSLTESMSTLANAEARTNSKCRRTTRKK